VVFDVGSRLHLGERRPWLLDLIDVILDTVARPDQLEPIAQSSPDLITEIPHP
jgi:hypothetical protein